MIDNQRRLVIPKEWWQESKKVNYYYSIEDKLFYFIIGEKVSESEYLIATRIMDCKGHIYLLKEIEKIYKTTNILLAKKGERIYMLPIEKD